MFAITYWINGPKQSSDWNLDIRDGYRRFVGHVFRGAFRYYIKDIGGFKRPGNKTRYIYVAKNELGGAGVNWIILPFIKIGRYEDAETGFEYDSDEIFSATCHETGHTSHMQAMNAIWQYWQVGRQLQESWAIAIEWYISHIEYAERGVANYGQFNYYTITGGGAPIYPNDFAYQYWNGDFSGWYTNLYIDIVDDHNELGVLYPPHPNGSIDDQVSGYTLPSIESDMLKHIYGLSSLSEQLKSHKPAGATDAQIDLLISYY